MRFAFLSICLALLALAPAPISAATGIEFTRSGPPLVQDLLPTHPGQPVHSHGDGGGP